MAAAGAAAAAAITGDPVRALLLILAAAPVALACSSTPDGYVPLTTGVPTNVLTVDIDTGPQITLDPGKGVGVAVQYAAGGNWTIATACDTIQSGFTCAWDLVVSVSLPNQLELVGTDARVYRIDPGAVRIVLPSQSSGDAFNFSAPPGIALELDVILDGTHDGSTGATPPQSFVSWVQNGVLQTGAPSNPVDFRPISPADAGAG